RRLYLPRGKMTVAHDDPMPDVVDQVFASAQVTSDLRLDRLRQHLASAVVQHLRQDVPRRFTWERDHVSGRLFHGGVPPCPSGQKWMSRNTQGTPPVQVLKHNF